MGVAMSAMEYPKWDVLALEPASGMDGPASDAVGSVSLREGVSGFEGAAV